MSKKKYKIGLNDLELEGLIDDVWEVEKKLSNGDIIIIYYKNKELKELIK